MGKVSTRHGPHRPPVTADPSGGPSHAPLPPLRGREDEIELIGRVLDRAQKQRRGTQAWISGPPGIGKSRLLLEAERDAATRGFTVIHLDAEDFPPAVPPAALLHALAGPPRPDRGPSALREMREDRHFHLASLALLETHLKSAPLMITCDEGRATGDSLTHALRPVISRLRASPLVWLTARSANHTSELPLPGAPSRLLRDLPETPKLVLGPLSAKAVSQTFADRTGGLPDAELSSLLSLTQGSPALLLAVVEQVLEYEDVRVEDGTARLVTQPVDTGTEPGGPASPGRVPRWFRALMSNRLAAASSGTRLLIEVAAVLGSSCLPEDIAEMLGEPLGALVPRFREAVAAGMVKHGTETVIFRHDLMRQVLLDEMPGVVRGAMHRQALAILMERGGSAASVATHLIQGAHRGDPAMAGLLRRAAEESVTSAPQTAADLALRGLELVQPQVETAREPLTVTAVEACVRSGSLPTAVTLAHDALTRSAGPETTARLRYWLSTALLLLGRTPDCLDVTEELLAQPGTPGRLHRMAILNQMSARSVRDGPAAARQAEQALRGTEDAEPDIRAGATTTLAVVRWREGRLNEALRLCQEAMDLADRGSAIVWHCHPRLVFASMLVHAGRFAEAEETLELVPKTVEFVSAGVPRMVRGHMWLAKGKLDEAEREASAGLSVVERAGARVLMPPGWMVLATVAVRRGDWARADACARRLRDVLPDDGDRLCSAAGAWIEAQLAVVSCEERRLERCLEELWTNGTGRRALLIAEPAFAPWLVRLLLVRNGRGRAAEVSDAANRLAGANPGFATVLAAADHTRGLVEGDAGALESAAANHRDVWARASAAEDLGALLADVSRARAIGSLEDALAVYGQLGAEGDAARVRRRLRAVGVRPRHWSRAEQPRTGWKSLTPTERTVADHVLQGLTNRQVATRMFLSQHTVAFHLRQIFRKLGVHSRMELARYRQDVAHDGARPPDTADE